MKVTHVREMVFTVYIGRPSVFGNPFVVGVHGNREECIRKFERYAWKTPRVLDAIRRLKKKSILGCHCSPKACHGDTIVRIWKQLTRETHEQRTATVPNVQAPADVPSVPRKPRARAAVRRVRRNRRSAD
jgi:hypothetical protein